MQIAFTGRHNLIIEGMNFQALVDGVSIGCVVTSEALHVHFPASSLEQCFLQGQSRIEEVAQAKIIDGASAPVYVRAADL
jgi:hypothetical protein